MRCSTRCLNDLTHVYLSSITSCPFSSHQPPSHNSCNSLSFMSLGFFYTQPLSCNTPALSTRRAPANSLQVSLNAMSSCYPLQNDPLYPLVHLLLFFFSGLSHSLYLFCKYVCLQIFCQSFSLDTTLHKVGATTVPSPLHPTVGMQRCLPKYVWKECYETQKKHAI